MQENNKLKETVSEEVSNVSESIDNIELFIERSFDKFIDFVPELIRAIIVLIIGLFLIRLTIRIVRKRFQARNVDLSLRSFLMSIIQFILYALLILTVIQILGFQTTALLGALSGLVLAAGLALQGSLSNFAGGVLILLFRPFNVGDYIENNSGTEGTVEKIDLLYTTLTNGQGIKIFSPNGPLANSVIQNFSQISSRRFDYVIGIGYEDNIKTAKEIILNILQNDERVLDTPAPDVFVAELGDSSVNLTIRGWALRANYWSARNSLQETIKIALDEAGINIPYPQQEMRIIREDKSKE